MLNCRTLIYTNSNTNMAVINKHKLLNLMSAGADERYRYFVQKAVDFEEVWGLYKDGWALVADSEQQHALAFWPEEAFAEACANGSWHGYVPRAITLSDFTDKWLPGMEKDKLEAAVFPNIQGKGVCVLPGKIMQDIRTELKNYT